MRTTLRNVLALTGLAVMAGASLSWLAAHTEERIERNRQAREMRILGELLGLEPSSIDPDSGRCADGLVVLRGTGRGYGGEFALAVAFDDVGSIKGVRVLSHRETPGFGDILDWPSAWLDGFSRDDVDAVTGATITSKAVISAVARLAGELDYAASCPP